jgi:hypothetical protein
MDWMLKIPPAIRSTHMKIPIKPTVKNGIEIHVTDRGRDIFGLSFSRRSNSDSETLKNCDILWVDLALKKTGKLISA